MTINPLIAWQYTIIHLNLTGENKFLYSSYYLCPTGFVF